MVFNFISQVIINYLTKHILTILFTLAPWTSSEIPCNSPPNLPRASERLLSAHPAIVCEPVEIHAETGLTCVGTPEG